MRLLDISDICLDGQCTPSVITHSIGDGFRSALVPRSPHLTITVMLIALFAFDAAFLAFGLRQFRRKAIT